MKKRSTRCKREAKGRKREATGNKVAIRMKLSWSILITSKWWRWLTLAIAAVAARWSHHP